MITYQYTSALLGISLAAIIFILIRRDHLHSRHAAWWFVVAIAVMLLGLFPTFINPIADILGISYPPSLLFLLGMGLLLLKMLMIDLHHSHLERKCRRLTQQLALLETELRQYQQKVGQQETSSTDLTSD